MERVQGRLPAPGEAQVLYLVDLSGYVFRAYHAIAPLTNSRGEATHAVMGTVSMLQKIVNERRPHLFAIAMDSSGPTFRKELDPRYKATRPLPPPDLVSQMRRCREIVDAYNVPVFQKDGLEADDLIAAVCARALAEGMTVVVVSADKDLMQLVRDDDARVVLWDSMRDRVYGPAEVEEKFGVPPSQLRDLLALMGDSSDNVPGVPSVGPKTASELLKTFGTLEQLYARLGEIKRQKLREVLAANEADARLSQRLVTLDASAEIEWDIEKLRYGGADVERLRALFVELEFGRLLDQLDGGPRSRSASKMVGEPPRDDVPRTRRALMTEEELEAVARRARELGRLAVDVVGTSKDGLRADPIGLSLSVLEGEGLYVPLGHRYLGAPTQIPWEAVVRVLGPVLADPAIDKIASEGKYVEHVLSLHGLPVAGKIFDPVIASYVMDPETPHSLAHLAQREFSVVLSAPEGGSKREKRAIDELEIEQVMPYGAALADMSLSVAARVGPRAEKEGLGKLVVEVELPLARVLVKMEQAGVLVDVAKLGLVGKRLEGELRALEARARELVGHDFAIRSRDQLETILFDELGLPIVKRTPRGGRSTDAEVLEELADKHPLPAVIVQYRELDKLKGTYIDALPRAVNPRTGRVHTRYEQTVAATGRLSSVDPNLQNIPIRSDVGREIRSAFVAPEGFALVSADYSQIELRLLAHLSGDPHLVSAFESGEDVHRFTASLVFDVPLPEVTAEMRRRAKTINFGVIYGMGDASLAKQLGVPRPEALEFIEAYFKRYAGVKSFLERTVENGRSGEAVHTILGRRRFLPNLHSSNRGLRLEAERVAKNTPIQGSAADIMKMAMLALESEEIAPGARMILTVHDELVFEVPLDQVERVEARARKAMEGVVDLRVPLVVDVGHGPDWSKAH